ncbi:tyrosine--tRNA ligase [Pelagibius sp.]|uniref:tyrosine--tRNA ligase n=1 Tax=Pelagibius sp. TaxID=1931238 RepID=UPI002607AC5C|nr:tyrosine--tRNA ligase [Pelagibius sp.]
MTAPRSDFLRVLQERGFIHQCTDLEALDERARKGCITAYIGFDATADSLHVGNMVQIMLLRWLQQTGHRPIALMGGGTTKIGDPSGKDEARRLLTAEQIDGNIGRIRASVENCLRFDDSPNGAMMVNNADWLDRLEYIDFLRDVGPHFTINRMLTFDSVRLRLDREQPLTFLEFNYMILQAYDYLELSRRYDCCLQMGGSDQWGNIVNGVELGRRIDQRELYGLTTPLVTTASGAKMGKTAAGAVWLSEAKLSNHDYWQYWRNTEDADVGTFLRRFTELPLSEIARLEALQGSEINEAKKILANEATRLCRGDAAAEQAAEVARQTFEEGRSAEGLPTIEVPESELNSGVPAYELLRRAGLANSNGEARRLIKGGGGRLNDVPIADELQNVSLADRNDEGVIKLSAGKKRHALIRVA